MRPFREFLSAVAAMRQLQIAYQKDKAPSLLKKTEKQESLVDTLLDEYRSEYISQKQIPLF
ncbi:hypothetical protein [Treponema socranskii]|uniref:hypothetical protein n=1 Tax=Treponema socranskii TaxID=53419 RepID=UPI0028F1499C|nr:hypothetical protein [Treponema socranskii]